MHRSEAVLRRNAPAVNSRLKPARMCTLLSALCAMAASVFMPSAGASTIDAINHTHLTINRFSVDGRSAIDTIGAYQGGGGGCCYIAPARWHPGMTVRIDWETGVSGMSELAGEFPGFADRPKYYAWIDKIDAQKRRLSKEVPAPDYTGEKVCGITVHFLPCDELQVSTSCYAFGSPEYPIKIPLHLPEPQSCPQYGRQ